MQAGTPASTNARIPIAPDVRTARSGRNEATSTASPPRAVRITANACAGGTLRYTATPPASTATRAPAGGGPAEGSGGSATTRRHPRTNRHRAAEPSTCASSATIARPHSARASGQPPDRDAENASGPVRTRPPALQQHGERGEHDEIADHDPTDERPYRDHARHPPAAGRGRGARAARAPASASASSASAAAIPAAVTR